jgi:hypothetical protein
MARDIYLEGYIWMPLVESFDRADDVTFADVPMWSLGARYEVRLNAKHRGSIGNLLADIRGSEQIVYAGGLEGGRGRGGNNERPDEMRPRTRRRHNAGRPSTH